MPKEEYRPEATEKYYESGAPTSVMSGLQDAELTRWQLDASEQIEQIKHSLKGEIWDNAKNMFVVDPDRKIINSLGAEAIASELQDRVNKISTMSNLTNDEIYEIIKRFEINLARLIIVNYDKWELKKEYMYALRDRCVEFVFIGLKRAEGKTFIGFLERSKQYFEKRVITDEQKKRYIPMG